MAVKHPLTRIPRRVNLVLSRLPRLAIVGAILIMLIASFDSYTPLPMANPHLGIPWSPSGPNLLSSGGSVYSGTGAARPVILSGTALNDSIGTMYLDSFTSGHAVVDLPTGWMGQDVSADIDHLSVTWDNLLQNGLLNDYHIENWLGLGYNDEPVYVPNGWTLTVSEEGGGSGRNPHTEHGIWEFDENPGIGYDDSMGFNFESIWNSGNLLTSDDEVYLSQLVEVPAREVYSAQVSFLYNVISASDLNDQTYLFVRFADHEERLHVLEPGDSITTWLPATVNIPASILQDISYPNALCLDIGLGTDLSGTQTVGRNSQILIDEIELSLSVRPFPEQVGLKANGTIVSGLTLGSASPFVPDDEYIGGVSSRDCRSWPSVGVHLDGRTGDGIQEVGVYDATGWSGAQAFQIAFQFPLSIPTGAAITSARLEIEGATGATVNRAGMRVFVADHDNMTPFTPGFPVLRDRYEWVDTSLDWYPTGSWDNNAKYLTPEFSPLVQSVISRPGWSSGNYLCVMLDYAGSTGYADWNNAKGSSDYAQDDLARLYIDFFVPESEDTVSSFMYTKDITIDHTKVSADLTDFPMLIDIYDSDLGADVQPDGDDIAFVIDGKALSHEIELFDQTYNSTHAHLIAWVRVPTLSGSSDTIITMCYGNPLLHSSEDPSGVWDDNYNAVWHLRETPLDDPKFLDSTLNSNDGTAFGSMTQSDQVAAQIDGGIDFDGNDDYLLVPDSDSLDITQQLTIEAWAYYGGKASSLQNYAKILCKSLSTVDDPWHVYALGLDNSAAGSQVIQFEISNGTLGSHVKVESVTIMPTNTWMHIVGVYDGSEMHIYVNGFDENQLSTSEVIGELDLPLHIGNWITSTDNRWNGIIDEVRLSHVARSADWILTEFNNQDEPASFFSVGPEESLSLSEKVKLVFNVESSPVVSLGLTMRVNASTTVDTLDINLEPGTSFSVSNGSDTVLWTANIPLTLPSGFQDVGFEMSYPVRDWKPISLTSALGVEKQINSQWTYDAGTVTVDRNAVDAYGIWKLEFVSTNHLSDLRMGPSGGPFDTTGLFDINQEAEFRGWVPWIAGASSEMMLYDPDGSVWYTDTNTTSGSSTHEIPSFRYKKDITIDHNEVSGDLTGFPVLLDISDSDLHDSSKVQSDGDDILFVSNGVVLAHEVQVFDQNYNTTHAHLIAWVKANLSSTVDTVISMYYGNPVVGSQQRPNEVWGTGYVGVWHLEETPTGAVGEMRDSTVELNDGYTEGSMNSSDSINAIIGSGLELDGIDDMVIVPESSALSAVNDLGTIQVWINWANASDGDYQRVMCTRNRFNTGVPYDGFEWAVQSDGDHFFYPWGGNGSNYNLATNPFTDGTWQHLVVTLDYYTKEVKIYLDGALLTLAIENVPTLWTQLAHLDDWLWGGNAAPFVNKPMTGMLDEIRVSDVVRSPEWIATEYGNQNDPVSFCIVGGESERPYAQPSFKKVLDSSAQAGQWTVSICHNDTAGTADHIVGVYERSFILKHSSVLNLLSPGDAVSDGLAVRVAGDLLLIEVELLDPSDSSPIEGASVTVNWTGSEELEDYGGGVYGKPLNTSILGATGRWRININSYHQYYLNASTFFDLDLSHRTRIEYRTPQLTPHGDDFEILITLYDDFDDTPLEGAAIASNGTIVGVPTDYNNGSYLVTIDSVGLSFGEHTFMLNATPSQPYMIESSVVVSFTYREIETDLTTTGTDPANVPWGQTVNTTLQWVDHEMSGIPSGALTGDSGFVWNDIGSGLYTVQIDVSSYEPGVYLLNFTLARTNYESGWVTVAVNIVPHRTYITATFNGSVPYGADTYVEVTFHDLDLGGSPVPGNFSQVVAQWVGGSSNHPTLQFWLSTDTWDVGAHIVNLTAEAFNSPRYYYDARSSIQINIHKLTVSITWDHIDTFPIGDDFEIILHILVDDPGSSYDDNPVNGFTISDFSAEDKHGTPYTIKALTPLGGGNYNLTIDQSNFPGGNYTIKIYLDFNPTENYYDTETPMMAFTYRAARSYLSSPDYPQVTIPYDTNVTITLDFEDIDRGQGIETATIMVEGATILIQQHVGGGEYEVLLETSGWSKGFYNINLTASAAGYDNQTISIDIVVRTIHTYAIPTVGALDIPVGDSRVFYVDYVDIDHDTAVYPATGTCNWSIAPYSVEWADTRFKVTIQTLDSNVLGDYLLLFNFSKDTNYDVGLFNISVTIRTIDTTFRLVNPVESTTPAGYFYISVYYGDLDHNQGIMSSLVECTVRNATGLVVRQWNNNTVLGPGYYNITISASQFGGLGTQMLTVYFNWTGPVQKYENLVISVSAEIVGQDSTMTLVVAAQPSACLENMSYTIQYADLSSGAGITNETGNVLINIEFVGLSIDLSQVDIWETDRGTQPGYYSIRFNTTLLGTTGLFSMKVFINWSRYASPYYTNRTDTISVRVLPRDTLLSVIPPMSTPFGENATFSFTFEDVTGGISQLIDYDSDSMTVALNLSDFSLSYDSIAKLYTMSFNTSQFGSPLGERAFVLNVTWTGIPFFANRTGRLISVVVTARQTSFTYPTPASTPYGDNTTFTVTFTDVTGDTPQGIDGCSATLYNNTAIIPLVYYTAIGLGDGVYEIEIDTSYFNRPGQYDLKIEMSTGLFYISNVSITRKMTVTYRITILTADPQVEAPYNSSLEIVLHYQDLNTLIPVANETGSPTTVEILNVTGWIYTCIWRASLGSYLLTVETYNQGLDVNTPYVLWVNFSAPGQAPFYTSADMHIPFQLVDRPSGLALDTVPQPASYLDDVDFIVLYQDLESVTGIENADIEIYYNLVQLQESTDYLLTPNAGGYYLISVHTAVLGAPGVKTLQVMANWTLGSPYHTAAVLNVSVTVTGRPTNVEILIPPSQTQFLDNVTTEFAFVDLGTGQQITISEDDISIYGNHALLGSDEYTLNRQGSSFLLSINSTEISPILVSNWNLTIVVDWNATAPYYFSDQTTIWITTTNRVGIVSQGQVLSAPMGDNLTLTIAFADGSTGQGIDSAIVALDCLEVPGLTENVDYWILKGSGVSAGNYTVLVSSTSLGTTGQFTFSLELNWNPLQQPYYRNVTNLEMRGTIRLVQSSIANDIPTPSLVPFHQNVSFLVNFTDLDHALQIDGAETDVSITYKSSGVEPSIWSIQPLSGGMYNITVNVTDLVTPGLQALVVSINYYPYQPVQIEVTFQVRLRIGVISAEVGPTNYAGYSTFVIVNLTDLDAIDAPLLGAALTLEWGDDAYYVELGSGLYNVTLDTSNLGHGTQNLNVSATLPYYQIQSLKLSINLLSVPSELIVTWTGPRHSTPYEVFWGESFTIYAAFNDTLRNQLIPSALVTYNWTAGVGNLTSSGIPGNYTVSLDTGQVESAATVTIYIQATGLNYHDASMQIIFHLLLRPIDVTPEDYKFAFSIDKGSPIDLILFVEDSLTGDKVANATVTVSWALGMNLSLSPVAGMPGYYQILLSTDNLNITTYKIDVVAYKPNHLEASTTLSVSVAQIRSEIWLDDTTAAYEYSTIIWSQVVRIGVYILTPALNESNPYSTGLPACTVWWSSPELGLNGTMLNGSLVGGPGYFYLDFNSTNYDAATYTFRLSATPLSNDYTDSETTVTLLLRNLPTTVVSPGSQNLIWGWTSLLNFTFNDTFHDLGIANAVASYYWAGGSGALSYLGDGVYAVPINASSVHPGVYPLTVSFEKLNHDNVQTSLTIRVDPVPTALSILVPYVHRVDGSATTLRVPYNDLLDVAVFYNNTATGFGISGANVDSALFSGPGFYESPFELVDAGSGNYTFEFDTRLWELGSQFTFYVKLSLENRTTRVITFEITIIETPTSVMLEGDPLISLFYGENVTVWVYYRDEWDLHGRLGIPDGAIHVSYDGTQYVSIEVEGADPTRPGYYSLTIFALRQTGSTGITIKLNKTYYESKTVQLTVSVSPSEADILWQNMVTYGSVSVLVILLAAVIWVRILKVPKIIRKLTSLLRQIRQGKVPKPDPSIKDRGRLISEIIDEMLVPVGVKRPEGVMPAHSIVIEVPEIEELLVEVMLLTGMTPEEIDEFRSDLSKMKLSDQTIFAREVKQQEVLRIARLRGASVEEVVAEVEGERARILSGLAPTVVYDQDLIAPPPAYPPEEVKEEKVPKVEDRLSEQELAELKRELEKRGLLSSEIEAMTSQARQLPKEVGLMMLKSMEKSIEPADVTEPEDRLSEKELDELRAELTRKKVKLREIESIVAQASELPRHLVDELAATIKEEPKAKKPPKTEERLTEEELMALGEELMMKGVSPEEVKSIVDQAEAVPRESAGAFIQKVKRADALTPAETVEFENRLSDFDVQDLRLELQKRGLPAPEIESIVAQAKNLPKSLIADLLDSIEPKDKD